MRTAFALVATTLALASCGSPRQTTVDHGWVRLPPVAGHPAAAYFELHGGPSDATLVGISTPAATTAQMHESKVERGMSSMVPLDRVAVPAGQTVTFEPGGKHVMLIGLNPAIQPGTVVTLHLTFSDGKQLAYDAPAIAANAPVPQN